MRLSKRIKNIIKEAILNSFGEVDVYLFGSRIHDEKRREDIAIDINLDLKEFRENKIKFLAYIIRANIDLQIDIVSYYTKDKLLFDEIQATSLKIE